MYACGDDRAIFLGIAVLTVLVMVSTYQMTRPLLVRYSIHPVIAEFFAAWAALFAGRRSRSQTVDLLGRLSRNKRLDLLIDLVAQAQERCGSTC